MHAENFENVIEVNIKFRKLIKIFRSNTSMKE